MAVVLVQLMHVVPHEHLDRADKHGWAPLHILASVKDENGVRPGLIRVLLRYNAAVDPVKARGQTPLMAAVNTGYEAAATELFNGGADVHKVNDEGTSVLDMTWHNRTMRNWATDLGIGRGAGVSGTGRLPLGKFWGPAISSAPSQRNNLFGYKPAISSASSEQTICLVITTHF